MSVVQPFTLKALPLVAQPVSTVTSQDIDTSGAQNLEVSTVVTVPNSGTVTVTVQGKDANGNYFTLLAGTAISTATTQRLLITPLLAASANAIGQTIVPRVIRLSIAVATNPVTFTSDVTLSD